MPNITMNWLQTSMVLDRLSISDHAKQWRLNADHKDLKNLFHSRLCKQQDSVEMGGITCLEADGMGPFFFPDAGSLLHYLHRDSIRGKRSETSRFIPKVVGVIFLKSGDGAPPSLVPTSQRVWKWGS
jgi:hypothetical protein